MDYENVGRAERTNQPCRVSEGEGELVEPRPDALDYHGQAFRLPALACLKVFPASHSYNRHSSGAQHDGAAFIVSVRAPVGGYADQAAMHMIGAMPEAG